MKQRTLQRTFIAFLSLLLALVAGALLAACKGKDEKYRLTLDLDGGSLSSETTLFLEEGANIYEAVKDLSPEKSGQLFHGWLLGDEALSRDETMPAGDLTLKASYDVLYTVSVYLQTLDRLSYERSEEHSSTGYGAVGETVDVVPPAVHGFEASSDNATSLTLGASGNEVSLYYDRRTYTVRYSLNPPAGESLTGNIPAARSVYGGTVIAEQNPHTVFGYRFAGWGPSANGGAVYKAGEEIAVEDDTMLYAVWERGYVDRYGSLDVIFLPEDETGVAILSRGGMEFRGTEEDGSFSFELPSGGVLRGKIFGSAFSYRRETLAGSYVNCYAYPVLPEGVERIDRTNTLAIDEYQGATYTEFFDADGDGAAEQVVLHGAVMAIDPDYNQYAFLITDEEYAGGGFMFRLGTESGEDVFYRSAGEEGFYYQFVDTGNNFVQAYGEVTLDGFGTLLYSDENYYEAPGVYSVTVYQNNETGEVHFKIDATVDLRDYGRDELELHFYTSTLSDVGMNAFFLRNDGVRGDYTGTIDGEEVTVTLDGYGRLIDSAVFTLGGKTYTNGYSLSVKVIDGAVILTTWQVDLPETEDGEVSIRELRLNMDFAHHTYTQYADTDYTEYFLFRYNETANEGELSEPLLLLYDGEEGKPQQAKLYLTRDGGYIEVASGECTRELLGSNRGADLYLYTFTRTACTEGYEDEVFSSCTFLLNSVAGNDGTYNVFYTLSENGTPTYEEIEGEGGAKLWSRPLNPDMGSVLFSPDGDVYDGGLSVTYNEWGDPIGEFRWINMLSSMYEFLYLRLETDADDNIASFTYYGAAMPEERMMFYVSPEGHSDVGDMATLLLHEDGRAIYAPDGDWTSGEQGSYRVGGTTSLGRTYYVYSDEDRLPVWEFVFDETPVIDMGEEVILYRYWRRDVGGEGTTARGAEGTLELDGFRFARYTTSDNVEYNGYYTTFAGTETVAFTATDGTRFNLGTEDGGLVSLDLAYGSYRYFYQGDDGAHFDFDGNGVVTLFGSAGGVYGRGRYFVLGSSPLECEITITLGGNQQVYTVLLEGESCTVRDEARNGMFVDENWNVLVLDGYNHGSFFPADGDAQIDGYVHIVDSEDGVIFLRSDYYFGDMLLVLHEDGTFELPPVPEEETLYFSEDLSLAIDFDTDGFAYYGNETAYYVMGEEETAFYFMRAGDFVKEVFPTPKGDVYTIERQDEGGERKEVTFYRYRGGEIVLRGSVSFDEEHGGEKPVTISFTPSGDTWLNAPARLTFEGETYDTTFVNFVHERTQDGDYRDVSRSALLDNNAYSYFTGIVYRGTGEGTFTAQGASVRSVRYDEYDSLSGRAEEPSELITSYYGFGPVNLSENGGEMSGVLNYPNVFGGMRTEFTVNGAPVLLERSSSEGEMYMVRFTHEGTNYAMSYYTPYDGEYHLYLLMQYEEVRANGGYTVGVGSFLYANSYTPYGNPRVGSPIYMVLSDGDGVILPFDARVLHGGVGAWMVALGTYDEPTGTGELGGAYFVSFNFTSGGALSSATVTTYGFIQAIDETNEFVVNLFLNARTGEPEKLAVMLYFDATDGWLFSDITRSNALGDDVWEFWTADGGHFRMTLLHDDKGDRVPSEDGWAATIERI